MAINFWESQRRARLRTALYLMTFILLTLGSSLLLQAGIDFLAREKYIQPLPYFGAIFLIATFVIAGFYYLTYRSQGGQFVAESLGGRLVHPQTENFKEQQLLNIVKEMSIASQQPMPAVYLIEAKEINAFAAGVEAKKAAITVTRGALTLLERDELEGVIAHEFGHIANGDMRMNMGLSAMIMGFVFILYMGIRLLQGSLFFGGRDKRNGNVVVVIGLLLLLGGVVTWFAGAILRAMVSRQREYLADACAVQFTRHPEGIAHALRKLEKMKGVSDMPRHGMAYSHLYFENHSFWASIFATHPPLQKRIAALEGRP